MPFSKANSSLRIFSPDSSIFYCQHSTNLPIYITVHRCLLPSLLNYASEFITNDLSIPHNLQIFSTVSIEYSLKFVQFDLEN